MKSHRRIGGMPGQESETGDGGISDGLKKAAVWTIKRRAEQMLQLPDGKNAAASKNIWGGLMVGLSAVVLALGHVLTGSGNMQGVIDAALKIDWLAIIGAIIGIVLQVFGKRELEGKKIAALQATAAASTVTAVESVGK